MSYHPTNPESRRIMTETIKTLLQPIQNRAESESGCNSDPCGSKVCKAQLDRPRLLAAVQAVTALHSPQGEAYRTCSHCIRPSGYPNRPEQPERYPCPTVAAIESALTEAR